MFETGSVGLMETQLFFMPNRQTHVFREYLQIKSAVLLISKTTDKLKKTIAKHAKF